MKLLTIFTLTFIIVFVLFQISNAYNPFKYGQIGWMMMHGGGNYGYGGYGGWGGGCCGGYGYGYGYGYGGYGWGKR
uniref:Candidate secreted effector n=1 Tax=Meloidogyne incognita TaxID=6306 RepID=A0A914N0M5_MELIC